MYDLHADHKAPIHMKYKKIINKNIIKTAPCNRCDASSAVFRILQHFFYKNILQ